VRRKRAGGRRRRRRSWWGEREGDGERWEGGCGEALRRRGCVGRRRGAGRGRWGRGLCVGRVLVLGFADDVGAVGGGRWGGGCDAFGARAG